MLLSCLYGIGAYLSRVLPLRLNYWMARRLGDFLCWRIPRDRNCVTSNLCAILGTSHVQPRQVREVFRHFAMYLVDFFRLEWLTLKQAERFVRVEGAEQMKIALAEGKGAIGVTAHLGNFELAGAMLTLLGFKVSAVVLTHQNPRVDAFFTRQRLQSGVRPIPVQRQSPRDFFHTCLTALGQNEIVGLVADRDFFGHGLPLPLFGRTIQLPTGPASLSLKTGAPIVPTFLVRESDLRYRFVLAPPIFPLEGLPRKEAVRRMTEVCLKVMEKYIRQYPTQWYMFREFWKQVPGVIL